MAFYDLKDDRDYADVRSASQPSQAHRSRNKKYYNFRGISPRDLPSHPQQQAHYSPDNLGGRMKYFATFPADLSTATIHKFTPREAYQEAQLWPRPPTYHHSRYERDVNKWRKQSGEKKRLKKAIQQQEWKRDWCDEYDASMEPWEGYCPGGCYDDYLGDPYFEWEVEPEYADEYEEEDDVADKTTTSPDLENNVDANTTDPIQDSDDTADEGYMTGSDDSPSPVLHQLYVEGHWHKVYAAPRFSDVWQICHEELCTYQYSEPSRVYTLGDWMNDDGLNMDPNHVWEDWNIEYESHCWPGDHDLGDVQMDWEVVSVASEPWTEVDEDSASSFGDY